MRKSPLIEAHDVLAAASLLSRIPLPVDHARVGERGAAAAWAWPLVGAVLGGLAGGVGALSLLFGAPAGVAAGLVLVVLAVATGALHEDGLADCADGLGGGRDRDHALDIMKDSRVGAYGVVALVLALGLRWQALAVLEPMQLVLAAAVAGAASRAVMLVAMTALPAARSGGLSAGVGRPTAATAFVGTALALVLCFSAGFVGLIGLATAALFALPLALFAKQKLGGQTGDVLGGVQQCAEIGALVALAILL